MQRYFVKSQAIQGTKITIYGDDFYHITKVMRMKVGDEAIVCDELHSWRCGIVSMTTDFVELMIKEQLQEQTELPYQVTLAQGIVRREKMEEVIDKITQLGASAFLPVEMERCNVKFNEEKKERKLERMQKIAKEASEQSHRSRLLSVSLPLSWNDFLQYSRQYDLCIFAYEGASIACSLSKCLLENKYQNVLVLVGPEGGFSPKEVTDLMKNTFHPVTLGPRILRTELAPVYVLSAMAYEWGHQI